LTSLDETAIGRRALRRINIRLFPFLVVLYLWAWIDRTNVAIAALQMNRDLQLSASAYGFGVGIFFLGYALFEIPSNLILARAGARRWIARLAITWGLVASATMFVRTPLQFYGLRVLLAFAAAAGASLAACGCVGAALLRNPYGRVAAIALVEIGSRSYVPPFLCLAPSLMRGSAAAAAIALVNTVSSLGGFVGPSVVGWVTDATGNPDGALVVLAAVAGCAAVLCTVVLRSHPSFRAAVLTPGGLRIKSV
jgi:sugar phosphate permease